MSARPTRDQLTGGEPRVQLLPAMVRDRAKSRRTRRLLAFSVVVALVVAAGATGFSYLRATQAESALLAERDRTALLLAQQAQFAESAHIDTLVRDTKNAQLLVTAAEVRWSEIFAELTARIPAGYSVGAATMDGRGPWESALVPAGVLRDDGIAVVSITLVGGEYRSPADFARAISFLSGVEDFFVETTDLGAGGYNTRMTFTLDTTRLQGRFLETEAEGEAEAGDAAPDESDESTPSPTPTEETQG